MSLMINNRMAVKREYVPEKLIDKEGREAVRKWCDDTVRSIEAYTDNVSKKYEILSRRYYFSKTIEKKKELASESMLLLEADRDVSKIASRIKKSMEKLKREEYYSKHTVKEIRDKYRKEMILLSLDKEKILKQYNIEGQDLSEEVKLQIIKEHQKIKTNAKKIKENEGYISGHKRQIEKLKRDTAWGVEEILKIAQKSKET